MTLSESTLLGLRDQLVAGVDRSIRRRRARRRIAAVVPLVAIAVGGVLVMSARDDIPAYALTEAADGSIRVEVYPGFDDVDDLQDSLARVGLQTVVVHLKAHPSLDGVIEVTSHDNEGTGALEFDGGEFVIEPASVEGEIEILIYSAAEEGEDYQFAPSIFAPDQALAGLPCASPDSPLTSTELERRANDVGIVNIEWVLFERASPGEVAFGVLDQRPDGIVTGAQLRNADTLSVTVVSEPGEFLSGSLLMSDGTHDRQPARCTPELAARWK